MKNEKELSQNYLNEGGVYCPFCKSENIRAGHADFDDTSAWRNVVCENCHKEWTEHFVMAGIEFPFEYDE